MTKEELYTKYTEEVQTKAREFIEKNLADVKGMMPIDEYDEAYTDLYNIFITGANTARDILVSLLEQYGKEKQAEKA